MPNRSHWPDGWIELKEPALAPTANNCNAKVLNENMQTSLLRDTADYVCCMTHQNVHANVHAREGPKERGARLPVVLNRNVTSNPHGQT